MVRLRLIALRMALGLGSAALVLSVAGQFGRVSRVLDVLNHFSPLLAAAALGGLLLAAVGPAGRTRRAALAASVIALLVCAAQIAPEFHAAVTDRRVDAAPGEGLKIVQFNALGDNDQAGRALRWIVAQDADVVVLQEAGGIDRTLVRRAGYHASCSRCDAVVLTREPPVRTWPRPGDRVDNPYLSASTIADPRGEITIVGVHRHWPVKLAKDRASTAKLNTFLEALLRRRLIIAGDFNSTPWSFARRREDQDWGLIRRTRALFTWPAARVSHNRLPAPFPYMPIDHVYAGPGWSTVSVELGPALGSDHYPVVVVLAPTAPR